MSGAFLLWFVAEIISFSPNTYDNNKFLYVTYVFVCCLSAGYGIDLLRSLKKRSARSIPASSTTEKFRSTGSLSSLILRCTKFCGIAFPGSAEILNNPNQLSGQQHSEQRISDPSHRDIA